jgi:hypothetical protein
MGQEAAAMIAGLLAAVRQDPAVAERFGRELSRTGL